MKTLLPVALVAALFGYALGYWRGAGEAVSAEAVSAVNPSVSTEKTTPGLSPPEEGEASEPPDYRGRWPELFSLFEGVEEGKVIPVNLQSIVDDLDDAELAEFLKSALAYPDRRSLRGLLATGMVELGSRGSETAMQFMETLPVRDRKDFAFGVFRGLAQNDPEIAWDLIDNYRNTEVGSYALSSDLLNLRWTTLWEVANRQNDVPKAMGLALRVKDPRHSRSMVQQMAKFMVQQNPEGALAQVTGDENTDQIILDAVVKSVAETNPQAAFDWLRANPDLASADNVGDIADNIAVASGVTALESLHASMQTPELQDAVATQAVVRAVRDDLQLAADWIDRFDSPQTRARAGYAALNELGVDDNLDVHLAFIELGFSDKQGSRQSLLSSTAWRFEEADPDGVQALADRLLAEEPETYREVGKKLGWDMSVLPEEPEEGDSGSGQG